jgi:signal transduction histidine kinase
VIIGVTIVGAVFYGLFNNQYLSSIIGRTLGPYSDALAAHIFATGDPEIWQQISERHNVLLIVEPAHGEAVAFDSKGRRLPEIPPTPLSHRSIRAIRTAPDGSRVTLYWAVLSLNVGHLHLLLGLLVMLVAVVGSAFWFLQRELRPLTWLHSGVEAVARGDFAARVPVIRNDEIGQVAGAFNEMAGRVGDMIDDRERLLADVSHELRSPIARMKVALEFLPEGDKRDALAGDLREMEHLIAVLLEREELRSPSRPLQGKEIDLRSLVDQVMAGLSKRQPGVELEPGEPLILPADPALIRLLIQNLVDNALKFSRPESDPVRVRLESDGRNATLRILDDGIGLPTGAGDKLFEPFVKGDPARGHGVGYGVGLNLCQRIVQLHGGTIRLQRREPRGTEVLVTLPLAAAAG